MRVPEAEALGRAVAQPANLPLLHLAAMRKLAVFLRLFFGIEWTIPFLRFYGLFIAHLGVRDLNPVELRPPVIVNDLECSCIEHIASCSLFAGCSACFFAVRGDLATYACAWVQSAGTHPTGYT